MKKYYFNFFILFLYLLTLSCSTKDHETVIDTIPVASTPIEKGLVFSEVVADYELVKLEDSENSLVGTIDKLDYHKGRYYLLERFDNSQVSVFDKSGKFLFKIGGTGQGPGEFEYPYDFYIDDDSSEILVLALGKINYYSLKDGVYLRDQKISIPGTRFSKIGDHFVFVCGRDEDRVVITNERSQKIDGFFEKNVRNEIKPLESFHKLSDKLLYHMILSDTIYEVTGNEIAPSRVIDFGKYAFSEKELSGLPSAIQASLPELKKNLSNYMAYIKVYDETDQLAYFTFNYKKQTALRFACKNKQKNKGVHCFRYL